LPEISKGRPGLLIQERRLRLDSFPAGSAQSLGSIRIGAASPARSSLHVEGSRHGWLLWVFYPDGAPLPGVSAHQRCCPAVAAEGGFVRTPVNHRPDHRSLKPLL